MKPILIISFLLFSVSSFSQDWKFESPSYDQIEKNIKTKKSNLFYDTLMNRFQRVDSTMTLDEKRHLYYGYSFNEKYSPYSRSDFNDSLKIILQKESHDKIDLDRIIKFGDSILVSNPFDLSTINYQLYALEQNENKEGFGNKFIQLTIIIDAIISSGNGKNKKDAFYVIYTSNEYNLISILGFEFGGTQSLIEHYDYLTIAENDAGIEGLYFDVSPCLNSMAEMFKD